jgi:hypothetical protein
MHAPAIRGDAPAVEGCGDFLAANRWKREREQIIFGHGERGWHEMANGIRGGSGNLNSWDKWKSA